MCRDARLAVRSGWCELTGLTVPTAAGGLSARRFLSAELLR